MKRRPLLFALSAALVLGRSRVSGAQAGKPTFKPEELDQILAPIALYSDPLLSQTLMASTYPLEIVQAARWSQANPSLRGDAAVAAVKEQNWDASVKSLVAFPAVLMQLNDHLEWTQHLGEAMMFQQQDVADSIQRLRAKAADAGNLQSGPQQIVTTEGSGADRLYAIQPTNPDTVYAPAYDPSWAYGSWSNGNYPPTYYPPSPSFGYGSLLTNGLMWGLGIAAASALFSNWNWGRSNSYVNVNTDRAINIDRNFDRNRYQDGHWRHDPDRGPGRGPDRGHDTDRGRDDGGRDASKGQRPEQHQEHGRQPGGGKQQQGQQQGQHKEQGKGKH